ncbi:unnamed protein product [Closterium sp. Naga37s-1]|nr:unnamed protein product [Closterium sp. Naga37s-1]
MCGRRGLTGVGLQGPIPTSISNLRELVDLDFNTNQLYGSIPTEVFTLTKLTHLPSPITDGTPQELLVTLLYDF